MQKAEHLVLADAQLCYTIFSEFEPKFSTFEAFPASNGLLFNFGAASYFATVPFS